MIHVDATVVLERPKIAPYISAMQQNISTILGLPLLEVSIKATSNEGLGWIGAEQGAAVHAVATIIQS